MGRIVSIQAIGVVEQCLHMAWSLLLESRKSDYAIG